MVDTEEIQVSLPYANSDQDPERNASEVQDDKDTGDTQNNSMKKLVTCQAILIVILMMIVCGVTGILFIQKNEHQIVLAELQHVAEEVFSADNNTMQLQIKNGQLKQLLNSTFQNFTLLTSNYVQLELLMNATLYNLTVLSAANTQLSMLLKKMLQEKTQLQVENKELSMLLNSTLDDCNLVEAKNRQLNLLLNESMHRITLASAETKRLRQLLISEQQTSLQLEAQNKHQRSILFSDSLSFLWGFCNRSTLQCSRCLPGWVEHASRCFWLSQDQQKWEVARQLCTAMGGDLAVVLNAEDQAFLTNLTYQYTLANPEEIFHSAWIGLQDLVKEGVHLWVNGNRIKSNVIYWKHLEPNNAIASWDKHRSGQDCVAIVPPKSIGVKGWLNSWDDIVCVGKRHYLCETMALILR